MATKGKKEVDGEEDGEITSRCMQGQHGSELQKIEMSRIYMRRTTSYTLDKHSLNDDHDDDDEK